MRSSKIYPAKLYLDGKNYSFTRCVVSYCEGKGPNRRGWIRLVFIVVDTLRERKIIAEEQGRKILTPRKLAGIRRI